MKQLRHLVVSSRQRSEPFPDRLPDRLPVTVCLENMEESAVWGPWTDSQWSDLTGPRRSRHCLDQAADARACLISTLGVPEQVRATRLKQVPIGRFWMVLGRKAMWSGTFGNRAQMDGEQQCYLPPTGPPPHQPLP